jgi:hypothetical protein
LAGVIFALHPLAVEPVSYVSSRSESLATAFLLLCVLFHIRSRQTGGAPRHVLLSTGSLAAGLLCKATAVTAPLLIGAYEILILKSKPRVVLQRLLPSLALVAAYVIFVRGLLSEALLAAPVRDMASQLATQAKAFSYYARLVVLPHPLAVEHPFSSSTWLQLEPWLGLACLLSVLGLVLAVGLRRLRFLLLWPMLVLLPTTVIPLNVLVSEHRLYPAMAGLACAGALSTREFHTCCCTLVSATLRHTLAFTHFSYCLQNFGQTRGARTFGLEQVFRAFTGGTGEMP